MSGDVHEGEIRPLKRHAALQPLSREHMSGLVQARNLQQAAEGDRALREQAIARFVAVWRAEIEAHFDDEERLLLPLIDSPPLRARLLDEHRVLRELAARCETEAAALVDDAAAVRGLGMLLHDHIRWEERVLFETVQRDHAEALAALEGEAHEIETRRPGARARKRL